MLSFSDHARFESPGSTKFREIPYHHFNVKCGKRVDATKCLVIIGVVAGILAGIVLSGTFFGTTGFYLAGGEGVLSILTIASAFIYHYVRRDKNEERLQKLPLPKAQSVDEYIELLDVNQENRYNYSIDDLLRHHFETNKADLGKQTQLDLDRDNIYMLNGFPISLSETEFSDLVQELTKDRELTDQILELARTEPDPILFKKTVTRLAPDQGNAIHRQYINCRLKAMEAMRGENIPEKVWILLNQSLFPDLLGVLNGRYDNDHLNVILTQRQGKTPTGNTLIEVYNQNDKTYIRMGQIFQLVFLQQEAGPFYVKAELLIDLHAETGRIIWTSPQNDEPTLI